MICSVDGTEMSADETQVYTCIYIYIYIYSGGK